LKKKKSFYQNDFLSFYRNIVCKNIVCDVGLKLVQILVIFVYKFMLLRSSNLLFLITLLYIFFQNQRASVRKCFRWNSFQNVSIPIIFYNKIVKASYKNFFLNILFFIKEGRVLSRVTFRFSSLCFSTFSFLPYDSLNVITTVMLDYLSMSN